MDDMQPITIRVEDRKLPELKREELFNGPPQKHISLRPSTQRAHSAVSPGQKINRTFTKEDDDFILMGGDSLAALRVVQRVKSLLNDSNEDETGTFG